jgi:16S rRNA (cytosine1402-N4)-methyltransferase
MAGGDGFAAVAGGSAHHVPVLVRPAIDLLNVKDGGVYIDGTFGAGGYTRAILGAADCRVIAIDRDPRAIVSGAALAAEARGRLLLVEDRFSRIEEVARAGNETAVNGIVLDVGVSSMQLDEAARGFSFRNDGPLDMRMGASGPSAADVIEETSERDLADIIFSSARSAAPAPLPARSLRRGPRLRSERRARFLILLRR